MSHLLVSKVWSSVICMCLYPFWIVTSQIVMEMIYYVMLMNSGSFGDMSSYRSRFSEIKVKYKDMFILKLLLQVSYDHMRYLIWICLSQWFVKFLM